MFRYGIPVFAGVCILFNFRYAMIDLPKLVSGKTPKSIATNWWVDPQFNEILGAVSRLACDAKEPIWIVGETNELNPGSLEHAVLLSGSSRTLIHDVPYPGPRNRAERPDLSLKVTAQTVVEMLRKHAPRTILVLQSTSDSPVNTDDFQRWNRWKDTIKVAIQTLPESILLSEHAFPDMGMTVEVYSMLD